MKKPAGGSSKLAGSKHKKGGLIEAEDRATGRLTFC